MNLHKCSHLWLIFSTKAKRINRTEETNCKISRLSWRLTDLRLDDDLHDCEEGVRLLTGVHALEPLVAVLVGLLQRHVQVVVRLLGGKVLQRMKQARLHSLFLKQGQAASWNLAFTLAKLPDTDYLL